MFTERHELGLFSQEDYLQAFRANGLDVIYDPDPEKLAGRGVYVGVLRWLEAIVFRWFDCVQA